MRIWFRYDRRSCDVKNVFIIDALIFHMYTYIPLNIMYFTTYRVIVILNVPWVTIYFNLIYTYKLR